MHLLQRERRQFVDKSGAKRAQPTGQLSLLGKSESFLTEKKALAQLHREDNRRRRKAILENCDDPDESSPDTYFENEEEEEEEEA